MRWSLAALAALGSNMLTARALMVFESPPAFSTAVSPSKNPVHAIGTPLDIKWSAGKQGVKLSVFLYQLDAAHVANFDGSFKSDDLPYQFITHDQVDATSYTWFVGTGFDLSVSPMFAIAVWADGAGVTDSATIVFNITQPGTTTTCNCPSTSSAVRAVSSSSVSVSPTSSPSATPLTGTTSSSGPGSDSSALSDSTQKSSSSLSTGAAVGVGIGAAVGVALLVALAWYFGRRAGRRHNGVPPNPDQATVVDPTWTDKHQYTGQPPVPHELIHSPVYEVSGYRPHELS